MAIGYVSTSSVFSSTSFGTSVVLNNPPDTNDDDLLVAFVSVDGVRTLTPPSGWTIKRTASHSDGGSQGGDATVFILVKDATTSDPSSWSGTLNSSSSRRFARVIAYSGCDVAANQFLAENFTGDSNNTPLTRTTPTVNNTDADSWRLSLFHCTDNAVSTGNPHWFDQDPSSEVERFDHQIGSSEPALTVAVYDSNGVVATGNTEVSSTWTSDGSGVSLNFSIAWIGLLVAADEESEPPAPPPEGSGLVGGTSYQGLLNPLASTKDISVIEDQNTPIEGVVVVESESLDWFVSEDDIVIGESASPILKEFSIVFNESLQAPGFDITVKGLLEPVTPFDKIDVFRRDPTGRYKDQSVRGLANVVVSQNDMMITDYEAPLNAVVHYYLRLFNEEGIFEHGPFLPTPQPYIPTMSGAYGGGTVYMKIIDNPLLSRPLMMESMRSYSRKGRVLGQYEVLGRRNPVIITDVMGGKEGSFSAHSIFRRGQHIDEIDFALSPGVTVLLQNHNPTTSTLKDMYLKVTDVDFDVVTPQMTYVGELEQPFDQDIIVTFTCNYIEVDRPDPTGQVILTATWQGLFDTHTSWQHVYDRYETWNDVYLNPFAPEESS